MSIIISDKQERFKFGEIELESIDLEMFFANKQLSTDGILFIDARDSEFAKENCQQIRQHQNPAVYLRPIVLLATEKKLPLMLHSIGDEVLLFSEFDEIAYKNLLYNLDAINLKIEKLPDKTTDANLGYKIVRYLFVRSKTLTPIRSINSKIGFIYPEIMAFLGGETDEYIFQLLEFLEAQNLLNGSFFAKSYFCNHCHSAFLNFQEICPHCQSADLNISDLIHHYRCAYVGPEKDFFQGSQLICPKCDKELRHIGVDFDKPSIVYSCNQCAYDFQEADIKTVCFNCGAISNPEALILRKIKSYTLTTLAKNVAIYGLEFIVNIFHEKELQILPYQAFKVFLNIEIERIKRYNKFSGCLLMFKIVDIDKLYIHFGRRTKEIFDELGDIFKTELRRSDVITSLNDFVFLIILAETTQEKAEIVSQRLTEHVSRLFRENLQTPMSIETKLQPIEGNMSADEMISEVIEHAQ